MARISSYPIDVNIQDNDAWIGTESSNRLTRQFTAQGIADYLNINSKIAISAQMVFKFVVGATAGSGDFTTPLDANGAATLNFADIASIKLSIVSNSGMAVTEFVQYLNGSQILINQQQKIDEFGHYTITGYTDIVGEPGFKLLSLEYIGGTGVLVDKKTYDFASFYRSNQGAPTFVFPQTVPAVAWGAGTPPVVTHNLGKFPSITVIDTGNTVVQGEYTYIDNNTVALAFSAPFAGKAYLN